MEAQERLLHDVLGLAHAAEHPVGDRERPRPQLLEQLARCTPSPSPSAKPCAPGRIPRLPAQLALGLRVRRAAHLGHHDGRGLAGQQPAEPARHAPRRLGAAARPPATGSHSRPARARRRRRGRCRAGRARSRPRSPSAASSMWMNDHTPPPLPDHRELALADLLVDVRLRVRAAARCRGRRSRRSAARCPRPSRPVTASSRWRIASSDGAHRLRRVGVERVGPRS